MKIEADVTGRNHKKEPLAIAEDRTAKKSQDDYRQNSKYGND
jgi:hypothetical protein